MVDKRVSVFSQVGDFGLSKLKDATLLNTKSGRGTVMATLIFSFVIYKNLTQTTSISEDFNLFFS